MAKPLEEVKKSPENVEEVLEVLGGFGNFQILILILLLSMEIPTGMLVFVPVFIGATPSAWYCNNETVSRVEVCSCNGTFSPLDPSDSVVSEWGLICESAWVSDAINSVQMIAMLVGNACTCQIADWYGRRYSFFGITLLMALGQALTASSPNPFVYLAARFICGASFSGFLSVTAIYSMEFMTPKWRSFCSAVGPFGIGIMLLGVAGYYVRAWRTLAWIIAAPYAACFVIFPFVPESPRWLLRNQRVEECFRVTNYIARVNRKEPVSLETLQYIADRERKAINEAAESVAIRRFTYLDFCREKQIRKTTLYLQGLWFAWGVVYFGISYNIKNLAGNPYFNVIYMGLVDAIGYPSSFLIADRLGRRKSLFVTMTFAAIFLVIIAILQLILDFGQHSALLATLCLFGRFGVAAARSLARTLTGESYPTAIRSMGIAFAGSPAGIAGAVSSQLVFLGSHWPSIPFFAFGGISIVGSLMGFLLNETSGKALEEDVAIKVKVVSGSTISQENSAISLNSNLTFSMGVDSTKL